MKVGLGFYPSMAFNPEEYDNIFGSLTVKGQNMSMALQPTFLSLFSDVWSRSMYISVNVFQNDKDVHPLLRKIADEQWFPKSSQKTVPGVVSAFIAIMDNVDPTVHTKICDYILDINK